MSEKPILFNTEMVRAILDGRKTVTRRLVKKKGLCITGRPKWGLARREDGSYWFHVANKNMETVESIMPPYQPGDILWVREAFAFDTGDPDDECGTGYFVYRSDYGTTEDDSFPPSMFKWRPSIHMPREAARIFLSVTDVRVEKLQDITVDSALREGTPEIEPPPICKSEVSYPNSFPRGFEKWDKERQDDWFKTRARATYIGWCDYADGILRKFSSIWNSTIKRADLQRCGWDANPWVWVIEFEKIER